MVSMVVTVLAIFGLVAHYLQGLVLPEKANALATAAEPFLSQGREEAIDWQRMDERVFAKALNLGRPILLVVGSGDSYFARQFDKDVLAQGAVMGYLRRAFVCVRIDADSAARWLNAFGPISRVKGDYLSDLGVYALNPQGRLIRSFLPATAENVVDFRTFLEFLSRVDQEAARTPPDSDPQREEVAALVNESGPSLPDFAAYLTGLIQADNPNGGFPTRGVQHLLPFAWRFLLLQARVDAFRSSVDPVLLSPIVNWLDGGFFLSSRSPDWTLVDFDESAELDAEMMWTLALASQTLNDPFYRWLAERTFDRLASFGPSGWVSTWQRGDEGPQGRSARYSFPPRELRELFPDDKFRDWVQDSLDMRVSVNPLMVPQLRSRQVWEQSRDRLDKSLQVLRKARTAGPDFGQDGLLEVNGLVAARMLACARLWQDRGRLATATKLAEGLDTFRSSDDVSRTSVEGIRSQGTLLDYLAYADACLETFLATGRLDRFHEGELVLRRAIFLFAGSPSGVFHIDSAPDRLPPHSNPPELLDHYRESSIAWLIRLSLAYGQLEGTRGRNLTSVAYAATAHFSSAAMAAGPYAAGFYCSASRVARAEAALCVGPRADLLAQQLFERSPCRIVAVAGGEVRGDLARRKPGIYIVRGEETLGPVSLQEAIRLLPPTIPFDVPPPR